MPRRDSRHSTLIWRKSKASNADQECVEMASTERSVLVRDSRDPAGPALEFSPAQWSSFMRRIREDDGAFRGLMTARRNHGRRSAAAGPGPGSGYDADPSQ